MNPLEFTVDFEPSPERKLVAEPVALPMVLENLSVNPLRLKSMVFSAEPNVDVVVEGMLAIQGRL